MGVAEIFYQQHLEKDPTHAFLVESGDLHHEQSTKKFIHWCVENVEAKIGIFTRLYSTVWSKGQKSVSDFQAQTLCAEQYSMQCFEDQASNLSYSGELMVIENVQDSDADEEEEGIMWTDNEDSHNDPDSDSEDEVVDITETVNEELHNDPDPGKEDEIEDITDTVDKELHNDPDPGKEDEIEDITDTANKEPHKDPDQDNMQSQNIHITGPDSADTVSETDIITDCDDSLYTNSDDSDYVPESYEDEDYDDLNIGRFQKDEGKEFYKRQSKVTESMSPIVPLRLVPNESDKEVFSEDVICEAVQRNIPSSCCLFESHNNSIYIKKYEPHSNTNSKGGRNYDIVHACFFCNSLVTNIQTHVQNRHKKEPEVAEILQLKNELKRNDDGKGSHMKELVRQKQDLLRNKGDNKHNEMVVKSGKGELLIARRKKSAMDTFSIDNYGPCTHCLEWIVIETTGGSHQKYCSGLRTSSRQTLTKGTFVLESKLKSGKLKCGPCTKLKNEVFPSMRRDNLTDIAIEDPLITTLGSIWFMKNIDSKRKRKHYASFRMRLAARLLILLREKTSFFDKNMSYFLQPAHFDDVAECTIKACQACEGTEEIDLDLAHPSTAIKLGYDIAKLLTAKICFALKSMNSIDAGIQQKQGEDFMKIMNAEWPTKVNKLARCLLNECRFNRRQDLPVPEDIATLSYHLMQRTSTFKPPPTYEAFREAVMLVQGRLLLYNKRRPGELEAVSLAAYAKRSMSISETDRSLRVGLSKVEEHLLETQNVMEIRVETGRKVPVIVPEDVQELLKFIANPDVRREVGISPTNNYLFANSSNGVQRAGDSIQIIRAEVPLQCPERIYATNLRKYTATISQVIGMKEHELKWLCQHLGHTGQLHEQHHRATSGLIERLEVAKLMMIQENNVVGKYAGVSLSDIQFEDLAEVTDEVESEVARIPETSELPADLSFFSEEEGTKKPSQTKRVTWTREEVEELKRRLGNFIDKGINVRMKCCLKAIADSKKENGILQRRNWETIKKKVNNMIKKN